MSTLPNQNLLEVLLDSYTRNNTILLNILRALPEGGLEARAMDGSMTIAKQFTHIRDCRLFFVSQTAPEFTPNLPELFRPEEDGWQAERNPERIAQMLNDSAKAVRDAVASRISSGQAMKGKTITYDHPVMLLQHMLWHEGYHTGNIMLALKAIGQPLSESEGEALMWSLWRKEEWA
jgi:uncharacterized damage-inducible protein DinB